MFRFRRYSNNMTSPETANIFILGATGYIGGSFVSVLLDSTHPPHRLTALIRSNDKLKTFENLSTNHTNCIGVQGSYEDHHLLERLASEHEVVISAADADDEGMMTAILKGMKKRHGKTGKAGVLIHVSGTGTIVDDSRGIFEGKDVRSGGFLSGIPLIPGADLHRPACFFIRSSTYQDHQQAAR